MKISIRNLPEVTGAFSDMVKAIQPTMEDATLKAVLYVQQQIPEYPPAPAMSTYRRTLQLFRSLTSLRGQAPDALSRVEASAFGLMKGFVGTNLEYAHWVVDDEDQTKVHWNNGWWTLQRVIEESEDAIGLIYDHAIDDMLRKLRFV